MTRLMMKILWYVFKCFDFQTENVLDLRDCAHYKIVSNGCMGEDIYIGTIPLSSSVRFGPLNTVKIICNNFYVIVCSGRF